MRANSVTPEPLESIEEWDDFVGTRYQPGKTEDQFRSYRAEANPGVTEFYRQNHANQTLDFVLAKRAEYLSFQRGKKEYLGSRRLSEYLG